MLWSIFFSSDINYLFYSFLVPLLNMISITPLNVALINIANILIVIFAGYVIRITGSFVIVFNSFALGVVIGAYVDDLPYLYSLLMPHALFETIAIFLLCTQMKIIFDNKHLKNKQFKKAWKIIFFICIPLFILSFCLESIKLQPSMMEEICH
ncbi:MAG: stage II sporulation protein M [Brevinemataceae bacterium]